MRSSPRRFPILLLAAGLFFSRAVFAQGISTDPVGYYTMTCSGSSDTILSIPFTEPPDYVGLIASTNTNGVVTVSGSAGWTANQFVYAPPGQKRHYYALIGTKLTQLNGTLSITGSSPTVTGSGTNFTSAVAAKDGLQIGQSYFVVKNVASDTSLTVTIPARTTLTATTGYVSKSPKEGNIYNVTANSGTFPNYTVTLDLNGDDISGVQPNTQISIIPYASLASVFPASDAGVSFVATTSTANLKTVLRMPDSTAAGINAPMAQEFYFFNGAWRLLGAPETEDHGNDTILPGAYFRLRNNDGTTTTLTLMGSVVARKKLTLPVATQSTGPQDNYLSVLRPLDVSLNQSGLVESGAFAPSTSPLRRADELYVFDNIKATINKSPSATYFYYNGAWRKLGQSISVDAGADVLPAGSGFIVRKATTAGGPTKFWENAQTFD